MYSTHRRSSVVLIPAAEPFRLKQTFLDKQKRFFADETPKSPNKSPCIKSLSFEEPLIIRKDGYVKEVRAMRYPVESRNYLSITFPTAPIFDLVDCNRFKSKKSVVPRSCMWSTATTCKLNNWVPHSIPFLASFSLI